MWDCTCRSRPRTAQGAALASRRRNTSTRPSEAGRRPEGGLLSTAGREPPVGLARDELSSANTAAPAGMQPCAVSKPTRYDSRHDRLMRTLEFQNHHFDAEAEGDGCSLLPPRMVTPPREWSQAFGTHPVVPGGSSAGASATCNARTPPQHAPSCKVETSTASAPKLWRACWRIRHCVTAPPRRVFDIKCASTLPQLDRDCKDDACMVHCQLQHMPLRCPRIARGAGLT